MSASACASDQNRGLTGGAACFPPRASAEAFRSTGGPLVFGSPPVRTTGAPLAASINNAELAILEVFAVCVKGVARQLARTARRDRWTVQTFSYTAQPRERRRSRTR